MQTRKRLQTRVSVLVTIIRHCERQNSPLKHWNLSDLLAIPENLSPYLQIYVWRLNHVPSLGKFKTPVNLTHANGNTSENRFRFRKDNLCSRSMYCKPYLMVSLTQLRPTENEIVCYTVPTYSHHNRSVLCTLNGYVVGHKEQIAHLRKAFPGSWPCRKDCAAVRNILSDADKFKVQHPMPFVSVLVAKILVVSKN